MTDAEFLAVFRLVVDEFAGKPDSDVLAMFDLVKSEISEKRFGSLYPQAAAYRTAHQFAWLALVASGGSTGASATGGAIVSEKEGDLQRSYADTAGAATEKQDTLDRTAYGQEFKRLARMCIVPVLTRM